MSPVSKVGAVAQVAGGCACVALGVWVSTLGSDPVGLAVSTGWSLAGAARFAGTAAAWGIALAGAGLSLMLFPLQRVRLLILLASVFVALSANVAYAPVTGTGQRIVHSTTDVPGTPTYYTRAPYLIKSGKDLERGVNDLLGLTGEAIGEMFGQEKRDAADRTVAELRTAPVLKAFERKIATTFDKKAMSKTDLERTRQPATTGDMRPSSPFVAR